MSGQESTGGGGSPEADGRSPAGPADGPPPADGPGSPPEERPRVELRVNGEDRRVPRGCTAEQLLRELELDPRGVVVEVNREIVRRGQLEETTLEAGDRVEIVRFVGGG